MKRNFIVFALLIAALQGCGKSDNSGTTVVNDPVTAPPAPAGTATNVYVFTQQIQGSGAYFFVNYQFKEGTCDTGLRRFSGPAPEIVRAQLCAGLRNEWMNKGCAPSLRQAYYAQMCY